MAWINIAEILYPVGSIYESTSSTSPADLFGGTWQLIDDVFLLGAGNAYSAKATGGEVNHTLTINEIPSHRHKQQNPRTVTDANEVMVPSTAGTASYNDSSYSWEYTQYSGGGSSHNNMPPYYAVYIWERTA